MREGAHEVLDSGVELRQQLSLGLQLSGMGVEAACAHSVCLGGQPRLDELGHDVELSADVTGIVLGDRFGGLL